MATIKVKVEPATITDVPDKVYYQISHKGRVRRIFSGYRLEKGEWNGVRVTPVRDDVARNSALKDISAGIKAGLARLARIVAALDSNAAEYDVADISDAYAAYMAEYSFKAYMQGLIAGLKAAGRVRTAETYEAAMRSFAKYCGADIMLDTIDSGLMAGYQQWLSARGLTMNSISFYNRILRAAYNRAADSGAIDQRHPFAKVYTGIPATVKRALPLSVMKRIRKLDLHDKPAMEYARDMFLLSFYLRGMSLIDMAYLRRSDLRNGYVVYRRRKTGRLLMIKWTPEMQRIVDVHKCGSGDYLLPVFRLKPDGRSSYRNCCYNINRQLHRIGHALGLCTPLTMYVARHCWATAARSKGVPLSVISEGMGHNSEATTRIYLASLDTSAVDKANSLVIGSI